MSDVYRSNHTVQAWQYQGGLIRADAPEWLSKCMAGQTPNHANNGVVIETYIRSHAGHQQLKAAPSNWIVWRNSRLEVHTKHEFESNYSKVST